MTDDTRPLRPPPFDLEPPSEYPFVSEPHTEWLLCRDRPDNRMLGRLLEEWAALSAKVAEARRRGEAIEPWASKVKDLAKKIAGKGGFQSHSCIASIAIADGDVAYLEPLAEYALGSLEAQQALAATIPDTAASRPSRATNPPWDVPNLPGRLRGLARALAVRGPSSTSDLAKVLSEQPSNITRDYRHDERWGSWVERWIVKPDRGIWSLGE